MAHALTTDGVRVAYETLGGSGPPLLLAHATGFHGHVWRPIAEAIADRFAPVIFDERGHGDTPPPEAGQSWHGFARDALAVVDGAGLDRPFGVGHSAGGAALLLAEIARPGTFRALWVFEPILPPPLPARRPADPGGPQEAAAPSGANPLAAGARRRREVFPDREAAYENYRSKRPFDALAPAALRAYVEHGFEDLEDGTVRLKCRGEVEARTYEMAVEHGAIERIGEIACPVYLASGARTDTPFGPAYLEAVASRMPDAHLRPFSELGHFGPLEDPSAIAEAIRADLS